jgi:two-component system chemotaxis response regulator CheB
MKIKVLVTDDSALIRSLLTEIINSQPDMEVVAVAPDPLVARDLIKLHNPDVLTLDIEMPKMDGLDFLERLMRLRPMPVVMISTLTERGSEITIRALELGAVDFVTKPKLGIVDGMREYTELIADKIRTAAKAKIKISHRLTAKTPQTNDQSQPAHSYQVSNEKVIIIGASTGGTVAISNLLSKLPSNCPGILIAQHMPPGFTKSFANRLDAVCEMTVKEAEHGEIIKQGHVYIAPGGKHLGLIKVGANYQVKIDDGEPVNRHKPSVDYLFNSAAEVLGKNATGIILTGMGKDGALGMLKMKNAGSFNFAQNEESCVVFGMPKEAIAAGGVNQVVGIEELPTLLLNHLRHKSG